MSTSRIPRIPQPWPLPRGLTPHERELWRRGTARLTAAGVTLAGLRPGPLPPADYWRRRIPFVGHKTAAVLDRGLRQLIDVFTRSGSTRPNHRRTP